MYITGPGPGPGPTNWARARAWAKFSGPGPGTGDENLAQARARAQFGTHPGSSRCDGHRLIMHFCNLFLGLFWDLSG